MATFLASCALIASAWSNAASQMSKAGNPAKAATQAFTQGNQAIRDQQKELAALLGKIDPVVAALGRLDDLEEQLRKHASTGLLPKDDFDEYAKKIQAMRDGLAGSDEQLKKTGVSAAQTAAAALAVAYKQGSDEQTAYAKALILTGNAAGVTTDQLADLARQVGSETGTIHDAADALTQFAATGKFASSQLGELATAALNFEDATGKAVSETVKEFARLADDPVKASQQLNEQYHYLTAAVYEQITALEKQGNTEEAAALAQKAYADALRDRSTQVIQSLGYIETAWKNIKEGAASAWDAMLGVGREQTPQQRLEELNKPAGFDQKGFFTSGVMFGPLGALYNSYKQFDAATTPEEDRRQEKAFLEQQLATKEAIAKAQGLYAEEQKKGVDAQREVDAMETQFLTNAQKRNKEIEKYRRQIEEIRKANPNDARLDEDRIAKNIANIEAKYKDPKKLDTEKQGYQQQLEGIGKGSELRQRLREQLRIQQDYQRDLARLQSQYNRGQISEEQYRQETDLLNKSLDDRLKAWDDHYKKLKEKQKDWKNGAKDAFQDYVDDSKNAAKTYYDLFKNALSGLEDSLTTFVMTGKLSFKDLANSIIEDLVRIQVRKTIAFGIEAFQGSSLYGSLFGTAQADGGAWSGGVQMFANGGAFTNSIVSRPTAFGMRNGRTGVMGEAGPEAIMPLMRTPDGALGVRVAANDSSASTARENHYHFNFPNVTNAQEAKQSTAVAARNLGQTIARLGRYG